jgi:hypothetical protein
MLSVANKTIMLSIIVPNVVMLSVVVLNVIMLSVVMLSVVMLSVVMLSVIMLNVVAPFCWLQTTKKGFKTLKEGVNAMNHFSVPLMLWTIKIERLSLVGFRALKASRADRSCRGRTL